MIIRICAHTLPFAAKIREVTPIRAAIRVSRSKSVENKLETITIKRDAIHRIHSFFVKFFIGLFILHILLKII